MTETNPDAAYFLDHYGECTALPAKPCVCLRAGWQGRDCPNWKPWGVRSADELMVYASALVAEVDHARP